MPIPGKSFRLLALLFRGSLRVASGLGTALFRRGRLGEQIPGDAHFRQLLDACGRSLMTGQELSHHGNGYTHSSGQPRTGYPPFREPVVQTFQAAGLIVV